MQRSANSNAPGLIRALGLWSAIAVIVGSMIGQAVFLVATDMARELGSPARVLAVWTIGGIVVLFGSLCYAERGAAMPMLVIGLYVLVNWTYFHVLGFSRVAESQYVASDTTALLIGDNGAKWITMVMIVSAFGALHATFLTGPRVPFAMARDGYFFAFAKRIHPIFHSPSGAVIFQGCVTTLLVLTGTYQELYSFEIFAIWLFLALTPVALIQLRSKDSDLPRPFKVWGYPWIPLVFGITACAVAVNLWMVRPIRSSIGLAIILLGVLFFYRWQKGAVAATVSDTAA